MQVLIVAKTRQSSRACIGALDMDTGRSLRLVAPDAARNEHAGMEYAIGQVWEIDAYTPDQIISPHEENVIVARKQLIGREEAPEARILALMPPVQGGPARLYGGLHRRTTLGSLYICRDAGVPDHSTTFWVPDRPLTRTVDAQHVRIRYTYPDGNGERADASLTFVGFQDPPATIPRGTLVRVSLAHWWRPDDQPDGEERCYVQLSGWFNTMRITQQNKTPNQSGPMQDLPPDAYAVLRRTFGYDDFLPLQAEAVHNVLNGQDCLVVLPTGGGKSLCYQLPALLLDGPTVVVSPLISLMQDQVSQLRGNGVAAAFLNSTLTFHAQAQVLQALRAGELRLLYVAPETLLRPEVLLALEESNLACLAIDEAHCISAWGHDFRPEYRQLAPLRSRFPAAVCIALTATATQRVREDILASLGMDEGALLVGNFDRPNLNLAAAVRADDLSQTLAFLRGHEKQAGIVYCSTRKTVNSLAARLQEEGFAALPYHAGLDAPVRQRNQEAWVRDDAAVMVATVAFGMGIDKSNVRFIVHYNLPQSLESYYQEIGRAGRDGLPADCLLLYATQDLGSVRYHINNGAESERQGRELRLQAMYRYAKTPYCRRSVVLPYFGGEFQPPCGNCDNCAAEEAGRKRIDVTVDAQKFLSCVARTNQRFGISHNVKILRGSREKKVLQWGHDKLSTYGIGLDRSAGHWKELAQRLIIQDILIQDPTHGTLQLTDRAWAVMKGEERVEIIQQAVPVSKQTPLADSDMDLFEILRDLRKSLADEAVVPAYIIFSDRSLAEMAAHFPQTEEQLLAMHGVGEAKLAAYGQAFLTAIQAYCAATGKAWRPPSKSAPSAAGPTPRLGASLHKRRFEEVGELFAEGQTVEEIAAQYDVKRQTVVNHLAKYVNAGGALQAERLQTESRLDAVAQARVMQAFDELGSQTLSPVYEALNGEIEYDELHLLRLVRVCQE